MHRQLLSRKLVPIQVHACGGEMRRVTNPWRGLHITLLLQYPVDIMNKYRPAISYRFQGVCIRPAGYVRSYSLSLTTRNNLIIGQSGGATAVINASLVGAVEAAMADARIDGIYGMQYGVQGLLKEDVIDLRRQPADVWQRLLYTPSAALGTCRYKLKDEDPERVIDILRNYDIRSLL